MKRLMTAVLAGSILLGASACQQPASDEGIQAIVEQQEKILAKLDAMDKKITTIQTAAATARRGPPPEDYNKVYPIKAGSAAIRGNQDAPVMLVEYSDFECPYCAKASAPIEALMKKYPNRLKVAYKHFPLAFHKNAKPVAVASIAAQDQGCFWKFHDVVFDSTSKRQLSSEKVEEYAKQAGCDVDRLKADLEAKAAAYEKRVQADMQEGKRHDVRGTPSLFINGKKVRDRSVAGMSAMIEAALKGGSGD